MSENSLSVTYKLERRPGRSPVKSAAAINAEPDGRSPAKPPLRPRVDPDRLARMLALAYYMEREIEAGTIKDYSKAARLLGMSRTRITQVANLLALSPSIQELVLEKRFGLAERNLRHLLQLGLWAEQERLANIE